MITMGSLFDGIGGFPLAAVRFGIVPLWASEIEAFPIEITKITIPKQPLCRYAGGCIHLLVAVASFCTNCLSQMQKTPPAQHRGADGELILRNLATVK